MEARRRLLGQKTGGGLNEFEKGFRRVMVGTVVRGVTVPRATYIRSHGDTLVVGDTLARCRR